MASEGPPQGRVREVRGTKVGFGVDEEVMRAEPADVILAHVRVLERELVRFLSWMEVTIPPHQLIKHCGNFVRHGKARKPRGAQLNERDDEVWRRLSAVIQRPLSWN